jgi:SAM-dependent methyltransferase
VASSDTGEAPIVAKVELAAAFSAEQPALAGCVICGADSWETLFSGRIRVGKFGSLTPQPRTVLRCGGCGVGFLAQSGGVDYESAEYRELVDGGASAERFYALHDAEQGDKLRILGVERLRDRVVADIGCGAGSFLDLAKGLASATLAIEPMRSYHPVLESKGHLPFSFCADVSPEWRGRVDTAVCFSVVEHVAEPVTLLRDIRGLLNAGGELLLSTPNLDDWMLELLPQEYGAFFFRTVHTWYFDGGSLRALAKAAGFAECTVEYVHRFDLSNALLWLRDRRPSGQAAMAVAPAVDAAFGRWLESTGRADYIYARLRA